MHPTKYALDLKTKQKKQEKTKNTNRLYIFSSFFLNTIN